MARKQAGTCAAATTLADYRAAWIRPGLIEELAVAEDAVATQVGTLIGAIGESA
jgi:hypothetical protein